MCIVNKQLGSLLCSRTLHNDVWFLMHVVETGCIPVHSISARGLGMQDGTNYLTRQSWHDVLSLMVNVWLCLVRVACVACLHAFMHGTLGTNTRSFSVSWVRNLCIILGVFINLTAFVLVHTIFLFLYLQAVLWYAERRQFVLIFFSKMVVGSRGSSPTWWLMLNACYAKWRGHSSLGAFAERWILLCLASAVKLYAVNVVGELCHERPILLGIGYYLQLCASLLMPLGSYLQLLASTHSTL